MGEPENQKNDNEGVRLIGAQEAAEALERGDVAKRRPTDAPRYGDRPSSPPERGPRPSIRFPLDSSTSPTDVERPQVAVPEPSRPEPRPTQSFPGSPLSASASAPTSGGRNEPPGRRDDDPEGERARERERGSSRGSGGGDAGTTGPTTGSQPQLPHWTEPPTGEIPRVLAGDAPDNDDDDDLDAWASFTNSGPRWRGESTDYDADHFDDLSDLGDDDTKIGALGDDPTGDGFLDFDDFDDDAEERTQPAPSRSIPSDPRRPGRGGRVPLGPKPGTSGRDMPTAVFVGVGLAAAFLVAAMIGPGAVVVLVIAALVMAGAEFYNAVRKAGHHPAVLLGLAAIGALPAASYAKGPDAIPLVLFLTLTFGLLWYLLGVSSDRPVAGTSITWLGVGYVGVLGSFAALMLKLPDGIGVLMGAVIGTVAYDVGGLLVGSKYGKHKLSSVSPNKTVEGLLGGLGAAVLASIVLAMRITPWTDGFDALLLGVVAFAAAACGDLCESLLKRDLGVKDMGDILPGHGGVLDRFDALLFVLPAVYYLHLALV